VPVRVNILNAIHTLNLRTAHNLEVQDHGRVWVGLPRGHVYRTVIRCGLCGQETVSHVDEQQALVSGDAGRYRAAQDYAHASALADRDCTLGMLRTKRGAMQLR